jgi:ABC-type glycerol-3-phosphate transport system substrate-binding protein
MTYSVEIEQLFSGSSMAKLAIFTPRETSDSAAPKDKTILRLAAFGGFRYQSVLNQFNAENPDYEIRVDDYSAGVDISSMRLSPEAVLKFNTALIAGDPPDIIIASGLISFESYISKGIFADLYAFIGEDAELGKNAFVPSILTAYENGASLYRLPVSFVINTVAAPEKLLDGEKSWNLDKVIALEKESGIASLPNKTSADILEFLLRLNLENFIDRGSGTCDFTADEFIKILEYANTFPPELHEINAAAGGILVREGRALADTVYLASYRSHAENVKNFGAEIAYIGYPSDRGSGSTFGSTDTVSISAKSKHAEAAWKFVRMIFARDFQLINAQSVFPGFPVNQAALDILAETEAKKENGAIPRKEIDAVNSLISSTTTAGQLDYTLFGIIAEESAPYFYDQKTAEEAASIIQSRISIYLGERK